MPRTKIKNIRKIKYFFNLLWQKLIFAIIAVDEVFLSRMVIDLTIKGLSLNQILEHIRIIYGLKLTKEGLMSIRKNAAKKAEKINRKLDKEVAGKINIIEVDEIFQNRKNIIIGAVEKKTQYLIELKHSPKRDEKALTAFLKPISRRFFNTKVIITDLLKAYSKAIKNSFPHARHLGCHVHAERNILRELDKLKTNYYKKKKQFEIAKSNLEKYNKKISKINDEIKRLKHLIVKDKKTKNTLLTKKQATKSVRTKTLDNKLIAVEKRIIKRSNRLSDEEKRFKKVQTKRKSFLLEYRKIEKLKSRSYKEYLQSCRLNSDFKRILADKTPKFEQHLKKYKKRLENSKYGLATHILKLMKNNLHLFSLRKSRDLASNYQNTNTIERVFGIFRPLLNSTRLIGTPQGTNEYCELFRLYYNTMPRYSTINNILSPFEQLKGKLNGKTYLDLIFPLRKRTNCFILSKEKIKSNFGFYVSGVKVSSVAFLGD